jgi:hypothetical protein
MRSRKLPYAEISSALTKVKMPAENPTSRSATAWTPVMEGRSATAAYPSPVSTAAKVPSFQPK